MGMSFLNCNLQRQKPVHLLVLLRRRLRPLRLLLLLLLLGLRRLRPLCLLLLLLLLDLRRLRPLGLLLLLLLLPRHRRLRPLCLLLLLLLRHPKLRFRCLNRLLDQLLWIGSQLCRAVCPSVICHNRRMVHILPRFLTSRRLARLRPVRPVVFSLPPPASRLSRPLALRRHW